MLRLLSTWYGNTVGQGSKAQFAYYNDAPSIKLSMWVPVAAILPLWCNRPQRRYG